MSKLYVPNEVYLLCSSGMHKQQLKVTSQATVKIAGGKLAGTIDDRTGGNFYCAKMVIAGAIAGAIIGAIIAATGGAALGAAMAIGAVAGAAGGLALSALPCLCAIFTMPNKWAPIHPQVTWSGKRPLLEHSKLPCILGGIISIYYSEEAAHAQAAYNFAATACTTAAIIGGAYLVGTMLASIGLGVSSVYTTFSTYGVGAGFTQLLGISGTAVTAYGVNKGYSAVKEVISIDGHSIDDYITGNAYQQEILKYEEIGQVNNNLGQLTKDEYTAGVSGLDVGGTIKNGDPIAGIHGQVSNVTLTTGTSTSVDKANIFVASSDGKIYTPGSTVSVNETPISLNSNPVQSPSYATSGGKVTSRISATQTTTPGITTYNITETESLATSQYGKGLNVLKNGQQAYWKGFNLSKREAWKNGFGLVILTDVFRALGNFVLAEQIDAINEAQAYEQLAKNKIKVKESEV